MCERMTERINSLTTKTQKRELEDMVEKMGHSQGKIIRDALDLYFEQQASLLVIGEEVE